MGRRRLAGAGIGAIFGATDFTGSLDLAGDPVFFAASFTFWTGFRPDFGALRF